MKKTIEDIITYAKVSHIEANQLYANEKPYTFHLEMAVNIGEKYKALIPEKDWFDVLGGIWCHDIIEDARQTYNDVLKNTNETIAEYAYALTNEKGRNRKARANHKYYRGIRAYKHARFIKLCDRIANVSYAKMEKSEMFEMYKKEHSEFIDQLYNRKYHIMWDELETLFSTKE